MTHRLNLLAAMALLVWGTHIARIGMLRVFDGNLRGVLAKRFVSRPAALLAGLGVTSLVQSATANCLIVASFVGKGLVPTAAALAVMLGADVGTALMAVVFSFDLSWLSPLLIFVGVVMFIARQASGVGRIGRVLIGLGLITLALQRIVAATRPMTDSPQARRLLLGNLLFKLMGGVLAVPLPGQAQVLQQQSVRGVAERLRRMDDSVDGLYSAIMFYRTQSSREALSERESRRWTDIASCTINMEQSGDCTERVLIDIEDKKIRKQRSFSEAGMAEVVHLDLLSELKRINSHIGSIACPTLESKGALAATRLRASQAAEFDAAGR